MARRENSFDDSDGRSLTPDLEDEENVIARPFAPSAAEQQSQQPPLAIHSDPPFGATTSANGVTFANNTSSINSPKSPTSKPSAIRAEATLPSGLPAGRATQKFRDSVRKVIQMKRTSTLMSPLIVGAEPGIDPRRMTAQMTYGGVKAKCVIDIVDYSSLRTSFGKMENDGFIEFMNNPNASSRAPWVKVRWINIRGISWDVISVLAMKYDIHPLAVEDILHQRPQARSKADYYQKHLFIRVLRHSVGDDDDNPMESVLPRVTDLPRSSSPLGLGDEKNKDDDSDDDDTKPGTGIISRKGLIGRKAGSVLKGDIESGRPNIQRTTSSVKAGRQEAAKVEATKIMAIEELKRERVHVVVKPMFICLYRDGTVISIEASAQSEFIAPILARLRQRDTGLRTSADPSLLVQSLLDLVVDQVFEIVDEYQKRILKLENAILVRPSMKMVRHLHILSGDIALHKRTLDPIKTLVYGLRRYDVDRCAALVNSASGNNSKDKVTVEGFMSHKSKIYLADVHDHIDYILTSMQMFANVAENLINFTFNMASYDMNQVMRRLTLATIIFLPLSFLTGYFGMNFQNMWSIHHNHTDIIFWIIAIPLMTIVIAAFLREDIIKMIHYVQKRWKARQYAAQAYRKNS
ncbi:hypothetical protein BD410DRAFT_902654 [Rickenella mellea]|uniref:Cora-domain-containing protein n=1 Tax=Rickenella mellea TaxID=50990 RepID=A0A4Y7PJY0_9AGAM|nr:hypothetical protein BD410DRAFT_902654 [Rickenella mellea]